MCDRPDERSEPSTETGPHTSMNRSGRSDRSPTGGSTPACRRAWQTLQFAQFSVVLGLGAPRTTASRPTVRCSGRFGRSADAAADAEAQLKPMEERLESDVEINSCRTHADFTPSAVVGYPRERCFALISFIGRTSRPRFT